MGRSASKVWPIERGFRREDWVKYSFEGLRGKLHNWEEDKEWRDSLKELNQRGIDRKQAQIIADYGENKSAISVEGAEISTIYT